MELELNIAVCDDEKYYRQYIKKVITEYLEKEDVLFHIGEFADGKDFCKEESNIQKYDIIFLDIEMEGMNGMDAACRIREKNKEMDIIFITVMSEYVYDGYKVRALRYILKQNLEKELPDYLKGMLKERKYFGQKMEFPFIGGNRKILLKDLLYIESSSHKLKFVREREDLYMYGKISDIEPRLIDYHFVRCHQSFLVNLAHVDAIKSYFVYLSNGTQIAVSRQKLTEVKKKFLEFKEI